MAKEKDVIRQKVTASDGYEYINGKLKQIKKTETIDVPSSLFKGMEEYAAFEKDRKNAAIPQTLLKKKEKYDAFIEKERNRILEKLKVERQMAKSDLTFREYAKKVGERKLGDGDVRITTEQSNNSIMEYINSLVGDYKMKDINKDVVHTVKAAINNKPSDRGGIISDKSKYNYFTYFRSIINAANEEHYYTENPIAKVKNFPLKTAETNYLTKKQLLDVFVKLANCHIKRIVEVLLILLTATRRAEALGLRWIDLKFDDEEQMYYFDLQEGYYKIAGEDPFRGELKTDESKGKIPVHYDLYLVLMKYKQWQDGEAVKLDEKWKGTGYIITRDDGGNYHPDTFTDRIRVLFEEFGYERITPHALRRSFATLAAKENVATSTISGLLRHADIRTTDKIYIDPARKQLADVSFLDAVLPHMDEAQEVKTPKKPFKRLGRKEYVR